MREFVMWRSEGSWPSKHKPYWLDATYFWRPHLAHGFHEDSSFRDAPEGIDGDRVMRPVLTVTATRFINEWTFWGTRRVDPVHQSPRTRAYVFFTKGTV